MSTDYSDEPAPKRLTSSQSQGNKTVAKTHSRSQPHRGRSQRGRNKSDVSDAKNENTDNEDLNEDFPTNLSHELHASALMI